MTTRSLTIRTTLVGLGYIGLAFAALLLIVSLASCETGLLAFEKSDAAAVALKDHLASIQEDGVVTAAEWQAHNELAQAYYAALKEDAGTTDWKTLLATGLGSVLASFTGVNIYRNKREVEKWGPPPAPPVA